MRVWALGVRFPSGNALTSDACTMLGTHLPTTLRTPFGGLWVVHAGGVALGNLLGLLLAALPPRHEVRSANPLNLSI